MSLYEVLGVASLDEGRDVVEFVEESGGLEQLFLTITQGVVQ